MPAGLLENAAMFAPFLTPLNGALCLPGLLPQIAAWQD
jgi:hypothetical protein